MSARNWACRGGSLRSGFGGACQNFLLASGASAKTRLALPNFLVRRAFRAQSPLLRRARPQRDTRRRSPTPQRREAAPRLRILTALRRTTGAWLGRQDSNLGMAESKSAALPLGYAPPGAKAGLAFARRRDHSARPPPPQHLPGRAFLATLGSSARFDVPSTGVRLSGRSAPPGRRGRHWRRR